MLDPTEDHHVARFETTRWSVVLAARQDGSGDCQAALAELCGKYWFPLYCFVRLRTNDVHRAQDITQAFFTRLLEKNIVSAANPERGKFRTFLLASLRHFMANEYRQAQTQKRGRGQLLNSLDVEDGERRFCNVPASQETPDLIFQREWAVAVLEQALQVVRQEYEQAGHAELFRQLRGCLTTNAELLSYAEIANRLGTTPGAVKVAVHRLRQRFRNAVYDEISQTLDEGECAEHEIGHLIETFSHSQSKSR